MKLACEECKKTIRKDSRNHTVTIYNISENKKLTLKAYKDNCYCYICSKKKYKDWCLNNYGKYNRSFKSKFWIEQYLQYKEFIEQKDKGKGTKQHFINKGKTEKEYYSKNKKLSVGINTLKQNGFNEKQIQDIRKKHSDKSLNSKIDYIKKYDEKEGLQRWNKSCYLKKIHSNRRIEYWISLGYSKQEAKKQLSIWQDRGSLNYFTKKYGPEEGKIKYDKACKEKGVTLENYIKKYGKKEGPKKFKQWFINLKKPVSAAEIDFFNNLVKNIGDKDYFYWGYNQHAIGIPKNKQKEVGQFVIFPDFVDFKNKKVIEFFGDYWHGNKNIFKDNDLIREGLTVNDIRQKDKKKQQYLKEIGYDCLIIWESEWNINPDKTTNKTIKFLKENNESNNKT